MSLIYLKMYKDLSYKDIYLVENTTSFKNFNE